MSDLSFASYQLSSRKYAQYPSIGTNITYPALGLAGEAGEVCDKIKKIIRDHGGVVNDERRAALALELGDVLWYVLQMCTELGLDGSAVAQGNLNKLESRFVRNAISGSGDDR